MKSMRRARSGLSQLLVVCGAAIIASALAAGPLRQSDVPPDSAWVLHVDFDALRQTYLGKYLLYQLDKPEMYSNALAFQSIFSADFPQRLHGLTVYGDGIDEGNNAVLLRGDFEPGRLLNLIKDQNPASSPNNGHLIYAWMDKWHNARAYGVFEKTGVIMSHSKETTIKALELADSLAKIAPPGDPPPAAGQEFLECGGRTLGALPVGPVAKLLASAKRATLKASEKNEQFRGVMTLEAPNETTADQLTVAARGLVALLGLQKDNPKVCRLADAILVKEYRSTVTVILSAPSSQVIAAIKSSLPAAPTQPSE